MGEQVNTVKSLEQLENDFWRSPSFFPTKLVEDVFALRKIPLKDLESNDVRLLLSQNVGLKYVVPKALNFLNKNILEESLYYPGDLLLTLLKIDHQYWSENSNRYIQFSELLSSHLNEISLEDSIDDEVKEQIVEHSHEFLSLFKK